MPCDVLDCQYRMPPEIGSWPNIYFYENKVQDMKPTTKAQDLPRGFPWPAQRPLAFVNVNGSEMKSGDSFSNTSAGKRIKDIVQSLLLEGRNEASDIGIITLYRDQKEFLLKTLPRGVLVDSVDASQGDELPIIILSLVFFN